MISTLVKPIKRKLHVRIGDSKNRGVTLRLWERESISLIKPALNQERKQMRASTVSGLRLILAIPKQSFPVLNALSLPALVAGILNISLAMFDNLGHYSNA
ncbi:hypothetical protein OUZ56_002364 [Daphnia magna]|uniref:Uncharacterized protein n=1 Tax=Daphnia magna TaxID=35525 RepID=A0ABR0A5X0_9CRUS|nr:hypothetical protein OUZ56_002364 [Daphnia magna]